MMSGRRDQGPSAWPGRDATGWAPPPRRALEYRGGGGEMKVGRAGRLSMEHWAHPLPAPDFRTLFESAPGLYLVLSPDLRHKHTPGVGLGRSEEHTSELQSLAYLVCRLLLEKKKAILAATKGLSLPKDLLPAPDL